MPIKLYHTPRGVTKQIGRMFLANGADIPLDANDFVEQCDDMCANKVQYENERKRTGGYSACSKSQPDKCYFKSPRGIQPYINHHANMNWYNLETRKSCCDDQNCNRKTIPCNSIRTSMGRLDSCHGGTCPRDKRD